MLLFLTGRLANCHITKGIFIGRLQLMKLGVQLRHVELQYDLVLSESQLQDLIQRLSACLSSGTGHGSLGRHSVVISGDLCSLPQIATVEILLSDGE